MSPVRTDCGPEKADFRPERAWEEDRWMDGWKADEQKPPCVLKDFVPFRAAAQKSQKSHERVEDLKNASNLDKLGQFDQIFFLSWPRMCP